MTPTDESEDERFLRQLRGETADHLRWASLLGAAIMIGFLWQDTVMSANGYIAIYIRVLGAIPLSAVAWYLSRNMRARRFISYISAFFWVCYAGLVAAIFISYGPGPDGLASSAGLGSFLIILVGIFTFSNLRFVPALSIGLMTVLIYTTSIVLWTDAGIADFIMGDFLTVVALMIGLSMKTLFTDRARSRLFETSELLNESYAIMEQRIWDRTSDLQLTNMQLADEVNERKRVEKELIQRKTMESRYTLTKIMTDVVPALLTMGRGEKTKDEFMGEMMRRLDAAFYDKYFPTIDGSLETFGSRICALMNDMGGEFTPRIDGSDLHITGAGCPWKNDISRNPILCMIDRGLIERFANKALGSVSVNQPASLANGEAACEFVLSKNG